MITIVTSPTQSRHQLNRVQYAAYAVALLAIASEYSYGTLKWLSDNAMATGDVHELGVVDGFKILPNALR